MSGHNSVTRSEVCVLMRIVVKEKLLKQKKKKTQEPTVKILGSEQAGHK